MSAGEHMDSQYGSSATTAPVPEASPPAQTYQPASVSTAPPSPEIAHVAPAPDQNPEWSPYTAYVPRGPGPHQSGGGQIWPGDFAARSTQAARPERPDRETSAASTGANHQGFVAKTSSYPPVPIPPAPYHNTSQPIPPTTLTPPLSPAPAPTIPEAVHIADSEHHHLPHLDTTYHPHLGAAHNFAHDQLQHHPHLQSAQNLAHDHTHVDPAHHPQLAAVSQLAHAGVEVEKRNATNTYKEVRVAFNKIVQRLEFRKRERKGKGKKMVNNSERWSIETTAGAV